MVWIAGCRLTMPTYLEKLTMEMAAPGYFEYCVEQFLSGRKPAGCHIDPYITNEHGERITGSALEEILNRRRKEEENRMKIYQVFFVHKESGELTYEYVVADNRDAAVIKASIGTVERTSADDYEIKVLTHFELD